MLEVMNAGATQLPRPGSDNAILLNCWEKSSPLIRELERTVNFAERKCGDLMQQLNFYKEYYEKWAHTDRINNLCQKKKVKKCCRRNVDTGSSSENEFEKVNQFFYKKVKNKIIEMNQEITQANRNIYYKNDNATKEIPLTKPEETEESKVLENKNCKSEPMVAIPKGETEEKDSAKGVKLTEKRSSMSCASRSKYKKRDGGSKRKYSNLQRYKIRSKSLPQGVRRKFGFGGFLEVFDSKTRNEGLPSKSRTSLMAGSYKSWRSRKSESKSKTTLAESTTGYKVRRSEQKSERSVSVYRSVKSKTDSRSGSYKEENYSKNIKSDPAFTRSCEGVQQRRVVSQNGMYTKSKDNAVLPSKMSLKPDQAEFKVGVDPLKNLSLLIAKPKTLVPFIRNPIPFIPCLSTSKTFNLGLNVQQVLSLIKHKKHSVTLQTVIRNNIQSPRSISGKMEPTLNTLFISQTTTSHSHVTSAICPAREASEDSFSVVTDNIACRSKCTLLKQLQTEKVEKKCTKGEEESESNKIERPEDVWVVDQPDAAAGDMKKVRSRCTCFPSKHCMDYHKVLREYTGWTLPVKTESIMSDAYSYHPVTACKQKLYPIPSQENVDFSLRENDGRIELMKVHNDLINLNRKYSSLQEQIAQNNLDDYEANAELDAMESELAIREVEFKDILNFYNQLMLLKEKLKSLRTSKSGSQSAIQQPQYQKPKKDPLRPTPSMALTKVLRKIQGLQDKIKLIDVP